MRPSVLTFTANPLAETTLTFSVPVQLNRTQRAQASSFQVGGKGLNVAKMLHRLGGPVEALTFAGGSNGESCRRWLERHAAYPWQLITITTETRSGTVVRSDNEEESTFLGPDCIIDHAAARAAALRLTDAAHSSIIAVCGSMPGWDTPAYSPLRDALLVQIPAERLVVDTYGPALAALVHRPLALVKINRTEFTALMRSTDLEPDLSVASLSLPVRRWVITDGAAPTETWNAGRLDRVHAPHVTEVSATGSGDVVLAAILAGDWQNDEAWSGILDRAAELGARNAAHPGVAEFELPA